MDEKTSNLWNILETNLEWIRVSDTKATAILTIYGIIITVVYSNAGDIYEVVRQSWVLIVLSILSGIASLLAIYFGFKVIQPRVLPPGYTSAIFFGSVVSNFSTQEEYCTFVSDLLDKKEGLDDDLARQIYINSQIASKKYQFVSLSIRFFVACMVLLLIQMALSLAL